MKKIAMFVVVSVVLVCLSGCEAMLQSKPYTPVGFRNCSSDWDCKSGEICTFVKIDTYAVCKGSDAPSDTEVQ